MIAIGPLLRHPDDRLHMLAVRHAWAKRRDYVNAAMQFRAARERLEEARLDVVAGV